MILGNGISISPGVTLGPGEYAPINSEWIYKATILAANTPAPGFSNLFGVNIANGTSSWNSDLLIGNRITNLTTGLSSIVTDIQYGYTYLQLDQTYAKTSAIVRINNSDAMPTGNAQSYKVETQVKEILLSYGTTNWTVPLDWNNSNNKIEVWGAGGGGGSVTDPDLYASGGGGGAYEYLNNLVLTPGQVISITIGQGGNVLSPGGNTIFGEYCSANGGGAGIIGSGTNPLNGASGSYPGGGGGYYVDDGANNYTLNGRNGSLKSSGGGAGYHYYISGQGYGIGGRGGYYWASGGSTGFTSGQLIVGGMGYSTPYGSGGGGAGSRYPGNYQYTPFGGHGGTPGGGGGAGYSAVPLEGGGNGGNGQIFITYRP
jgi:hypothetical protein